VASEPGSGPGARTAPAGPEVRAAGGLVWRQAAGGDVEVVVVHRPRYDDWSLPKGKCDPGEDDGACALREVEEETGLACRLGRELPSVSYRDRRGRDKQVRYWSMTPLAGGRFVANPEVDELRWCDLDGARELLSYDADRVVLASFLPRPGRPGGG